MPSSYPSPPFSQRKLIASVFLLLVFTLAVRLHHLDHESLFMDELRQVSYYPNGFHQIISDAASMAQPPLDYWIGHLLHFFSDSDIAVRLPSALFGTGSVLFLVLLIGRLCSWPTAMGVGLVSALLPFNLYFSQEARPYAIAIFFFLGVLWALNRLLIYPDRRLEKTFLLILFATAFLYSRTLSPLVVTVVLLFMLGGRVCFLSGHGTGVSEKRIPVLLGTLGFLSALFLYFPALNIILAHSGRYADTSLGFDADRIAAVVGNFDPAPMWRAFVAQSEPLGIPFLILLLLSPFFAWRYERSGRLGNPLGMNCVLLLPGAMFLNLFVFQAKTHMPFRPPYAIYLLPLTLILSGLSFQGIWDAAGKMRAGRVLRSFLLVTGAILILHVGHSALRFKETRKKPDWRGVSAYLARNFDERDVLIFDALSSYGAWEPTFYGFPRYYKGKSHLISMGQVPFLCGRMERSDCEPVLVLFQWREYYLTPHSRYPIMPLSDEMRRVGYGRIRSDGFLTVKDFTGFSVVRLGKSSGNLAKDSHAMITRLLPLLPANSGVVELHLAAAALARTLGLAGWEEYLAHAETLLGSHDDSRMSRMNRAGSHIRGLASPPEQNETGSP